MVDWRCFGWKAFGKFRTDELVLEIKALLYCSHHFGYKLLSARQVIPVKWS